VLVDDGSSDASPQILERLAEADPRVSVVFLSRNFGHQTALTAGLDHALGDAVVMLDADLQDPPELVPTMLDHWRAGCDVVYAVREHREGESRFKLTTARWFYKLFDKLTQVELQHNSGDFRLLDRSSLNALLSMRERSRFLRGMTVWVGYRQAAVPYRRDPRFAGETKYTLSKMLRFSLDAITSFSTIPLQLATSFGFILAGLSLVGILIAVIVRLFGGGIQGQGTTISVVLFLGLALALIPPLGTSGAALASTLTYAATAAVVLAIELLMFEFSPRALIPRRLGRSQGLCQENASSCSGGGRILWLPHASEGHAALPRPSSTAVVPAPDARGRGPHPAPRTVRGRVMLRATSRHGALRAVRAR